MMQAHISKRLKTEHEGRLDDVKPVDEEVDKSSLICQKLEIDVPDSDRIEEKKQSSVALEDNRLAELLRVMEEDDAQEITFEEQLNRAQQRFKRAQQQFGNPQCDRVAILDQNLSHIPQPQNNEGTSSRATEMFPPVASLPLMAHVPQDRQQQIVPPHYPPQNNIHSHSKKGKFEVKNRDFKETLRYAAPVSLSTSTDHFLKSAQFPTGDECPICMSDFMTMTTVKITTCNHLFHRECIEEAFKHCPKCPTCRADVIEPRGRCPSGTMRVTHSTRHCGGFTDADGSIVIHYALESGNQLEYHENPGKYYSGTSRTAYLPNNDQGRELLKRLKYAWMHGLSFTVGTSLTTGQANVITWASIHHKTSLRGGSFGFPDPSFFGNCNEELDALGVPESRDLA